jgi:hypothetical protein
MTIAREFFREQLSRLERQFNSGKKLELLVQEEYFMTMKLFKEEEITKAVDSVIQTHRPYTGHVFPSLATILDALNDVMRNTWSAPGPRVESDFCEQCRNNGLYMAGDQGRFCDCEKGKRKEIDFRFHPDKKKAEKEKEEIEGAALPHRGLKEWNPVGFYEDTQEEHDKWMAAERAKIAEIDAKRAKDRGLGAEAMENAATGLRHGNSGLLRALSGVLGQVAEVRAILREPGGDREEDAEAPL